VTLSNGGADHVSVERIADFPNHIPLLPSRGWRTTSRCPTRFGLVAVSDQIYVTDGGRNLSGASTRPAERSPRWSDLPPIPECPIPGFAPVLDAVPTGIAPFGEQLLVTLFRGAPFPAGVSTVQRVDPAAGQHQHLHPWAQDGHRRDPGRGQGRH
jgi:hypothetical protein